MDGRLHVATDRYPTASRLGRSAWPPPWARGAGISPMRLGGEPARRAGQTSDERPLRRALAALLASLLAECSALPTAGPTVHELLGQAVENNRARFDVVDVDNNVVATLLNQPSE